MIPAVALLLALPAVVAASAAEEPGDGHRHRGAEFTVCKRHCRYEKIQRAVDAAKPGATLLIGPGTYFENVVINKSVSLEGVSASETVVDGSFRGPVFVLGPPDPGAGAEQISVKLTSMTITRGQGVTGGGISGNVLSLQLADCLIVSNQATQSGGGIYVQNGNNFPPSLGATIESCVIAHNEAPIGAGIEVEVEGGLQINNSLIADNQGGDGAGLHGEYRSYTMITRTTISNNISSGSGGGIWIATPSREPGVSPGLVVLDTTAVVNNTAAIACGGIAIAKTPATVCEPGSSEVVIALNFPEP